MPSSGGKIVFTQHLVSSLSVNVCTVHRLRADCIDGRIILKWIFSKWDDGAWTGLIWLKIRTGDRLL
jgi:hypothetical protein